MNDDDDYEDSPDSLSLALSKLTRLIRVGWLVIVAAFISGGWSTTLEIRDYNRREKDIVHDTQLDALQTRMDTLTRGLTEVAERSYTFREAQLMTERLIVLETTFRAHSEKLQDAIEELKVLANRQSSL